MTVLVFAPNWLGDAVMALPAIADVRRHAADAPAGRGGAAERRGPVDDRARRRRRGGHSARARRGPAGARSARMPRRFAAPAADVAVLLPNSVRTALRGRGAPASPSAGATAAPARPAAHARRARPRGPVHQVDYYRHLVAALGIANGPASRGSTCRAALVEAARGLLAAAGWTPGTRLVGIAPGAAFGGAKRWPPERFAAVPPRWRARTAP